jgi:hypothetical protein
MSTETRESHLTIFGLVQTAMFGYDPAPFGTTVGGQ